MITFDITIQDVSIETYEWIQPLAEAAGRSVGACLRDSSPR
jgi:hypothetical protein